MRFDSIVCGVCLCGIMLSGIPAAAQEIAAEVLLKEEYNEKNNRINEMFQEKIAKISERIALPEEMRSLLIGQADEVREFDIETLKRKLDMKIRQAKDRDDLKERLRQDSQNRMKWLMQDEAMFQKNKNKKQVQLPEDKPAQTAAPVAPVPAAQPEAAAQPEDNSQAPEAVVPVPAENAAAAPASAVVVEEQQPAAVPDAAPAAVSASPAASAEQKTAPDDNRKKRGRFGNRKSRRPAESGSVSKTLAKETTTYSKQGEAVVKTNETVIVQDSQPVVNPDGSVTKAEEIITVKTQETVDPSAVPASAGTTSAASAVFEMPEVQAPVMQGNVSSVPSENMLPAPAVETAPAAPAAAAQSASAPAVPAPAPAVMDEDMIIMEDSPLIRASEEAFVVDAAAEQKNEAAAPAVSVPVSE